MRPFAERLYRRTIPGVVGISRPEGDKSLEILDREFAVDAVINLEGGMNLTIQEKFLSPEYAHLRSVTVEHYNDPLRHVPGDWFHLASQLYFCGYATPSWDGFEPWVFLDWALVVLETEAGNIRWLNGINEDGRARASFRYTPMKGLPEQVILAASWQGGYRGNLRRFEAIAGGANGANPG
jgi:hypothetical protein